MFSNIISVVWEVLLSNVCVVPIPAWFIACVQDRTDHFILRSCLLERDPMNSWRYKVRMRFPLKEFSSNRNNVLLNGVSFHNLDQIKNNVKGKKPTVSFVIAIIWARPDLKAMFWGQKFGPDRFVASWVTW